MDLLIGDPRNIPHPVRWIGKLIARLDNSLLGTVPEDRTDPKSRERAAEKRKGVLLVVIVVLATVVVTAAVLCGAYLVYPWLGVAIEAVLTCYLLAHTSLKRESMKVYNALKRGNLRVAKKSVAMIVGRDTDPLDEAGVARAAVETVAENLSDGVVAPMIFAAIGGPVLGLAYKAVNTMDSMVGYKNDRYMWFGRAAAKFDDVLNYIPSRLSALFLIFVSALFGNEFDANGAYRIWKRDRNNHSSPNAAQTESACAGALGVRLGGPNFYFGKLVEKPYIGDDTRPIECEDIKRANRLMTASSVVCWVICIIILDICA